MVDGDERPYSVFATLQNGIFNAGSSTRANVGAFMADLVTKTELWTKWRNGYPQLLDDTFSQVRAGKGNTRNKGGRMKSLLLLLDLSGAFKREIDMMRVPSPSVMRLRAQTAMGRARQGQISWADDRRLRAGTAGPTSPIRNMGSLITSPEQQRRQQLGEMKRPSTSAL